MGILDDAIRDHLELKRQRGAQSAELKRLEDEAFGPPARPGEPEFGEAGAAVAEATAPANGERASEEPDGEAATAEEPAAEAVTGGEGGPDDGGAVPLEPSADVDADASEAQTSFYDQAADDELTAGDVDLAVEEEIEEASAPEVAADPPIESLETVEHPLEPESGELEAPPPAAEPASEELDLAEPPSEEVPLEPASDEPDFAEPPSEEGDIAEPPSDEHDAGDAAGRHEDEGSASREGESSEEDVLADTPEFLRDQPEDDELWFEQGEPKDFDFD
jgi:hypothetical protein